MSLIRHLRNGDRALYRLLHGRFRTRSVDPFMIGATEVGTKSAIWLAAAIVLAVFGDEKSRRTAARTAAATLSAQVLANVLLKPAVRRKRPFTGQRLRSKLLILPPREHSWPSGHAASSAAAVTSLATAYPERAVPLLILGLAISYSRVYVGVHYPSDVAAGTAMGIAVGGGYVILSRRINRSLK